MPRDYTSPQAVARGQAGGKSVSNGAEVAALGCSQQLFPQLCVSAVWTVSCGMWDGEICTGLVATVPTDTQDNPLKLLFFL